MATVDSAPGSTAIGSGGGGAGGGGKKPNQGGGPPKPHYQALGGDTNTPLWLYDVRAVKTYILEWRSYSFPFSLVLPILI
jgi:hypothetical protein